MGRLRGRFARWLLVLSYATAIGFELLRMYFGGFGTDNLIEGEPQPRRVGDTRQVQLSLVAVFCLLGVGVLAAAGSGPSGRYAARSGCSWTPSRAVS